MAAHGGARSLLSLSALVALLVLSGLACSNQKPAPLFTPSSDQSGYASRFPEAMAAARGRIAEHESKAKRELQAFATYADEIKEPTSYKDVRTVVDLADSAGKSAAYVERRQEVDSAAAFFESQKEDITRSVAGAAQYTAKQKNCDVDTYGSAAHALEKSVEKGLEKYLREHNEAHAYIEDNQDALGKPNLEKLRKQADEISDVSYMVHVGIPQSRERVEGMVAEANDVKKTLDRTIEESKTVEADAARSATDKAAAKKRRETAEAAKPRVDSELQQAQQMLEGLEERQKQITKEYEEALDGLRQKLDEKAKAQPEQPKKT